MPEQPVMEITLGMTAVDKVTGMEGTITAKCQYLTKRPVQFLLESRDTTGRPIEWWVDCDRIVIKYKHSEFKEEGK